MDTLKIFRLFIVASMMLALIGGLFDVIVPGAIPQAIDEAYQAHTATDDSPFVTIFLGVVAIGLLVAVVFAVVGLLMLKHWSRRFAFWLTVVALVAVPWVGVSLSSGWALMFTEASSSLWAAALAMAYFSELKTHFERAAL